MRLAKIFFCVLIVIMYACNPHTPERQVTKNNSDFRIAKWDSIPVKLKDVNAYYIAYIDSSGTVYEHVHGKNSAGRKLNSETLFEGASLSKTVFAYLYWHLLNKKDLSRDSLWISLCAPFKKTAPPPTNVSPGTWVINSKEGYFKFEHVSAFQLLSHSIPFKGSCIDQRKPLNVFSYSETGYLQLQESLEGTLKTNLQALATREVFEPHQIPGASFLWRDSNTNYVDGYYEKDRLHRPIKQLNHPQSNGSLYINGRDLLKFTKMLMDSPELDSMSLEAVPVGKFAQLSWGRGIGIEKNAGKTWLWQWGNNWSYNHILLINKTDHTALICLTNSIIGAKRIRETSNWLLDTHFQLFDYINWY